MVAIRTGAREVLTLGQTHVRFGSKADICGAQGHVRFTPNSDRESVIPAKAMSALPPIADMCGATGHVCFGPKADISWAPSSFEPLPSEQEIVERLGSWRHTFGLRTKNIGVGGQHFDIDCFVDALDNSWRHN